METKMAKSKEPEVKTKNDALSRKIGSLKQNAFALIQESQRTGKSVLLGFDARH
jgi:hypothetical protein